MDVNKGQRLLMTDISIRLVLFWAILCAIPGLGEEGLCEIDRSQPTIYNAKAPVISSFNLL